MSWSCLYISESSLPATSVLYVYFVASNCLENSSPFRRKSNFVKMCSFCLNVFILSILWKLPMLLIAKNEKLVSIIRAAIGCCSNCALCNIKGNYWTHRHPSLFIYLLEQFLGWHSCFWQYFDIWKCLREEMFFEIFDQSVIWVNIGSHYCSKRCWDCIYSNTFRQKVQQSSWECGLLWNQKDLVQIMFLLFVLFSLLVV